MTIAIELLPPRCHCGKPLRYLGVRRWQCDTHTIEMW